MRDKIKTIIIIAITIILTAGTTVAASIAISASNITIDSDKTDKTNVADALDDLYDVTGGPIYCKKNNEGNYVCPTKVPKCVRGNVLHTEICNQTDTENYCSTTGSIGTGNPITYGNTSIIKKEIHTGDAFTCDVNNDGIYDEETERFYYVSDLYTGGEEGSETWNTNIAVLIYYSNIIIEENIVIQNNETSIAYDASKLNYQGPLTALAHLPNISQWSNVRLTNETRQIKNQLGGTTTTSGTYPITFSGYTNKAARLLTTQEINKGCELTTSTMKIRGALDTPKCRFLLENTKYANNSYLNSYWLETPYASNTNFVYNPRGGTRLIDYGGVHATDYFGIRPSIEVAKSDISY